VTTFLLIRHGAHDLLGNTLAGRTLDVGLDAQGLAQAEGLVGRLARYGIARVYVSPRRRARETIAPFVARAGVIEHTEHGIDEIDFGAWSGHAFAELEHDPEWHTWCKHRSQARPPSGERIADVQARVIAAMRRLRELHPGATLALVSHGDVIKAALAHYLHVHLDDLERFDIAPGSISVIADDGEWSQVRLVNATPEAPP
jgi:probable phosphoglycerate mutase